MRKSDFSKCMDKDKAHLYSVHENDRQEQHARENRQKGRTMVMTKRT